MVLKSEWKWQKKARKLEDRSAEITQFEEHRKKLIEIKLNMVSMTYETISNGLLYV